MAKEPKRLKLAVSNVPAVYADEISDEEWVWIKANFPDDYATARGQIKAHEKALAEQGDDEEEGDKPADNAPAAPKSESKKAESAGGKK